MTRRDEILKLIVEYYIKTAEPVGSKTLQSVYHLNVSSATIRNEMNALEQDGFLEKPHMSAGRVPSKKGYQYYTENLRSGNIDEAAKNALQTVLSERTKSVEDVIKESCEILSQMTNLASVVVGNNVEEEHLVSIQIIPLSANTASAVFVTDKGYVENKTFLIDKSMNINDIVKTVKLLNDRLSGTPVSQVVNKMEAMRPALTDYLVGQEVVYQALMGAFAALATSRMEFYGKDELYRQPEFANDAAKLRELIAFLEDPSKLQEALRDGKTRNGITVTIGAGDQDLDNDLAMVSANIAVPGESGATLSLVGPARMDYDKVVSTLRYFAEALDEYFANTVKGEDIEWKKPKSNRSSASKTKRPNPKGKMKK
ncbi:MAG: heat-inducible transcriptional repressor HrcA [Erysipelotrichaceae bacterium]|nr:heat-inducible transcriptional repressor HrcA [Erysipelotrichaceae bacterium]